MTRRALPPRFPPLNRGEGASTSQGFVVSQYAGGANMSVDVAAGEGWVRDDDDVRQGVHPIKTTAVTNVAVTAANGTNPRIDIVVAKAKGASDYPSIEVVAGTATAAADLENRTGAAAVPNTALHLADVLVPAASTSVVDANIRSRRRFGAEVVPPLLTKKNIVAMRPMVLTQVDDWGVYLDHAEHDTWQSAGLQYLPERIEGANRIVWKYAQDWDDTLQGNYVLGIYDASGRKIVDTGSVAFVTTGDNMEPRAETITATTFEPGPYYVLMGLNSSASGGITFPGMSAVIWLNSTGGGFMPGPYVPNAIVTADSGADTAPQTLLNFYDIHNYNTANTYRSRPGIPWIALKAE